MHINPPEIGATFKIHKSMLGDAEFTSIKSAMSFRSMSGDRYGFGAAQSVTLIEEDDRGYVHIPRRYASVVLSKDILTSAVVSMSSGYPISLSFDEAKQAARPDLKLRQDAVLEEFLLNMSGLSSPMKGGILCAPCGTGKTVVAAKLIAILGVTTLVLVHKEFLYDQWRERLLSFTDIKEDEIGKVQQDKCEFAGKKVVIAMVQSLLDRGRYPAEFYEWPGLTLYDETHRMGAPQFQAAVPQFSAKYRVGLTATPRRSDGLQPVFEWHIGKVLAMMAGGNEIIPKIFQIKYDAFVPENMYCWRDAEGKIKKLFLAKLTNILTGIPSRNIWIVKELVKAAKSGRKTMLLSDRREHLDIIKKEFELREPSVSVGYYVGGMKKEEREESAKKGLILGTFQMAKEGLDIPDIDTLFLSTPKTDVEQSVGRILRFHEGKKEPIVIDIVDTLPICIDFARKRLRQYSRLKWNIAKTVV
jgi:superfamily II DNA or RNA helicase